MKNFLFRGSYEKTYWIASYRLDLHACSLP